MVQLESGKKLRPWMGFVLQAIFIALFLTVCSWLQRNLGIIGLVLSELVFAVVAVFYCLLMGIRLKEMFPIKKITISEFFGVAFLAAAGFLLSLVAVGFSLTVLPKSFRSEVQGLNDFIYGAGMGYPLLVLIVAVLPAICEEMMERGAVISNFRTIKRDWVVILIMGIFFGIIHMSFLRFLSTALLGAILSYLLVKKNNILLPMLLHFMNNFASVTISALSRSATAETADITKINGLLTMGSGMVFGFAAPILLVVGMMLVDKENHKPMRFAVAGILSVAMLSGGVLLTRIGMLGS